MVPRTRPPTAPPTNQVFRSAPGARTVSPFGPHAPAGGPPPPAPRRRPSTARFKRATTPVPVMAPLGQIVGRTMARAAVPVAGAAVASPSAVSAGEGAGALTAVTGNLTWHLDRERAYAEAQSTGKPVFIDFYGSWCTNCKAFETLAVTDEAFNAALQGAVLLKVYDTSPLFAEYRDDERFPELRVGLPFFVITNPKGELLYKTTDFTRTDEMSVFLSMG